MDCKCIKSFKTLEERFVSPPILGLPDFTQKFVLEIDASFEEVGAVLSQKRPNGKIVIAYYTSIALRKFKRNMEKFSF